MKAAKPQTGMDPATVRLWERYKADGDPEARERLILQYSPLVKYVAGRVSVGLPNTVENGDLVSYGMFGLMDALDRFDLSKGFKFETYAITRIKGAIIDELRSVDWVPRSVRTKAKNIERSLTFLERELDRTPTEEELADHLEITITELRKTLTQVSLTSIAALDERLPGDDGDRQSLGDTLADSDAVDPQEALVDTELRDLLGQTINRMSEREKTVIVLYYFEGMTLAEIGEVLGVTESRVCQIHTKAVLGLRTKMVAKTK